VDAPLLLPGTVFPPPDDEVTRQWLALVHELARQQGGRVNGGIEAPRVDRSFYAVTVELRDGTVTLMLNVVDMSRPGWLGSVVAIGKSAAKKGNPLYSGHRHRS
jgi:hypothetical protein